MTTTAFRKQMKACGFEVRKQKNLDVFEVLTDGTHLFMVSFAELYPVTSVDAILAKKLRPEYIPPLG